MLSGISFELEFRDMFRSCEQVSVTIFFLKESDRLYIGILMFEMLHCKIMESFKTIWKLSMIHYLGTIIIIPTCQSILGFHSRHETAMLVYKTMAKCRSSFAQ